MIADKLLANGAILTQLEVYKRTLPKIDKLLVKSIWQDDAVDIILFTSKQAMLNTFAIFGDHAKNWLQNKTCLVISARLAAEAQKLGIKQVIQASYNKIIEALEGNKL